MNNIKKLLVYSISIIALFSLTAVSCDDLGDIELPDITVPTDIERTYVLDTAAAGSISKFESIDPAEDLAEYKDRIKSAEFEKISMEITDLLDGNSAQTQGHLFIWDSKGLVPGTVFRANLPDFSTVTETIEIEIDSETQDFLKNAVENDELITVSFYLDVNGPVEYQVDITFHSVITASAE